MPSVASMILRASREAARAVCSAASAASRCAAAALARSRSGGVTASDPLMRGSSVAAAAAREHPSLGSLRPPVAAAPSGSSPSYGSGSTTATPPPGRFPMAAPSSWSSPPVAAPTSWSNPPITAPPSWSSLSHGSGSSISAPPAVPFPENGRPEFVADEKDLESDGALWALYERWCKEFNQQRDRDEMAQRFSIFKDTVLMVQENKKAGLPYTLEITKFADGKLMDLRRPVVPIKEYVRMMPYSDSVMYGRAPGYVFTENLKRSKLAKVKSICVKNLKAP